MSKPFDPEGKVSVVTGAASGIGLGIAEMLVAHGGHVVLADANEARVQEAAERLGDRAVAQACDVSSREQVAALADFAWDRFGRVNLVVNNAGISIRSPVTDYSEADARRIMDVNFFGAWYGCAEFGARFAAQEEPAHILNTASENGLAAPVLGIGLYTASKHAVLGMSDVLRQELPEHVGVSVLCPGAVATRMTRIGKNDGTTEFGLLPSEVAEIVLAGLREGLFYIVTHAPVVELVDARAEEQRAAFERLAPRFEGDERLDTQHIIREMTRRARGES